MYAHTWFERTANWKNRVHQILASTVFYWQQQTGFYPFLYLGDFWLHLKTKVLAFLNLGKIKIQLVEHPKWVFAFEIYLNFPVGELRTEARFTEYGLEGL